MHLSLALAVLAASSAASVLAAPSSPESSLQNRAERKAIFQSRQATRTEIIKRSKQKPKQRRASPAACADVVGRNKIVNGDFQNGDTVNSGSNPPWQKSDLTVPAGASGGNAGFFQEAGYTTGTQGADQSWSFNIGVTGGGAVSITQLVSLCANTPYTLSYYSGIFDQSAAPTTGCTLTSTLNGVQLASTKVCQPGSTATECTLRTSYNNLQYRKNEVQYVPPTALANVPLTFSFDCGADDNSFTTVDQVVLTKIN